MKFKKKKHFWKEFFNECTGVIVTGAIMIYIALSMIAGNLILPCINNGNEINPYRINDLKLVETAMTGNIASITTEKDVGARSTLVYYIVETKTGEKIITRNGLIKPIIYSGDTIETIFDLDKLELNIYM